MGLLLLWIVLAFGFVGRATAMVNHDLVPFAGLRAATIRRWGPDSYPAQWIVCAWCVSVWFALPAAVIVWAAAHSAHIATGHGLLFVIGLWFSLSWAVALTAQNLDGD